MGYYSEVRAVIFGEEDKLLAYITAAKLIENNPVFHHFKDNLTTYHTTINTPGELNDYRVVHVLEIYGENWKWNESYEDVQAWMNFMRNAPDHELDYEFARVGEGDGDNQDVETEQSSDDVDFFHIRRPEIVIDISKSNDKPFEM